MIERVSSFMSAKGLEKDEDFAFVFESCEAAMAADGPFQIFGFRPLHE